HARKRFDPDAVRAVAQTLYATLGTQALRDGILAQLTDRRYTPGYLDQIGDALARGTADDAAARLLGIIDALREPAKLLCKRLKPSQAQVAAALREIERTITVGEAIAAELLPAVLERIGADKAERGLFDYDDMLVLVHDALRGPRGAELAARLRARTPWVMID